MKASTILGLPILAASAVSAQQETHETGPFLLRIANAANETLNGQFLYSCHAGAAIEGLCTSPSINSSYFLNTTGDLTYGALIWKLPLRVNDTVQEVPSAASFEYDPSTNVAVPLVSPSESGNVQLGFDDKNRLYLHTTFDDSHTEPGTPPDYGERELRQWYACYARVGGYFYSALAWVTAGEPHNPTCQAVEIVKEDL